MNEIANSGAVAPESCGELEFSEKHKSGHPCYGCQKLEFERREPTKGIAFLIPICQRSMKMPVRRCALFMGVN